MSRCNVQLSRSMRLTALLEVDLSTYTETLILQQRSKSGPATALIVRISQDLTHPKVDLSRLFRAVNLGEGVTANATVRVQYGNDSESVGPKSTGGLAI